MLVPMRSTWLISSVPASCKRSVYGFDDGSMRKFMLWNRYCIVVRISPLGGRSFLQRNSGGRVGFRPAGSR